MPPWAAPPPATSAANPIVGTTDIGAYESGTFADYNAFTWESLPASATIEQYAGTFDFDGDGVSNANEWLALTDPADPASYPRISQLVRAGSNLNVTFPTVPGRNYAIEFTNDFATWMPIGGTTVGTGNPITLAVGPVNPFTKYFVRVRVGP